MSSLSSVAPVATRASARAQSSDRVAERRAVAARPGRASGPQVAPRLGDADASRAPARRGAGVVPRARKGMLADTLDGDGKKKKKDKKASKTAGSGGGSDSITGSLEPAFAGQSKSSKPAGKNWIEVGNVSADFQTKPIKPLVLANGNFILVKWEDLVFCADCNSTAYQYPLIDGEIFFGAGGPAIRVPLDGTEYDLTTGEVITWCPKNNPIRSALGTLKGAAEQVPLPVYPVRVEADGSIFTNFVDKAQVKRGFSNDAAEKMSGGKGVEIAMKAEDASGADDSARDQSPATPPPAAEESLVSPAILVGIGLVALATVYLQMSAGGDVPAPPQ
jgi:nitrite reductase/ring-hydroxylating ferredoxin subunit